MSLTAFIQTQGPQGPKGPGVYALVTGDQSTNLATPTVFGVEQFTFSNNPSVFRCVASAPTGYTMNVRITDLTAGGTVLLVVSTNSTSPVALTGNFVPLSATPRLYSVEGYLSGGVPNTGTIGHCYSAYVEA